MPDNFDLVVIGGGPAGYGAALYAGSAGLSVGLIEKDKVGGTCLHRGCIPAKEFLETATIARTVRRASEFGIEASQPQVKFEVSYQRKNKVVSQLHGGLQGLLKKRKVVTYLGAGTLQADGSVEILGNDGSTTQVVGNSVLLASGSVPRSIPGFEFDGKYILSSDDVLDLQALPESVVVIGGGAIGCEFASMMADLGVQVTMLEALANILPGCDREVALVVEQVFKKKGIDVRTGVKILGYTETANNTVVVSLDGGNQVEVSKVIVSVGRKPYTQDLLDDSSGVDLDEKGFVKVGPSLETSRNGVYAIGDLINTPQLAHVGFAEAIQAVKVILGESWLPIDYHRVPWCIYSNPEVAFAGYSEDQARSLGYEVVTHKTRFSGNSRAMIIGETEGLVKVVCQVDSTGKAGSILGVHMAGPWVTEQLGAGYLATNWEATPDDVASFVTAHPTLSEAFGEAVLALTGRGLHG